MLITTGVLLGVVLLVMVGEQAQEMQLAHWISKTEIGSLANLIPPWMGMWFAVFPTYETIAAQLIAAVLVIGSYYAARHFSGGAAEPSGEAGVSPALRRNAPDTAATTAATANVAITERLETVP
jgi:high-affinity iron transporter